MRERSLAGALCRVDKISPRVRPAPHMNNPLPAADSFIANIPVRLDVSFIPRYKTLDLARRSCGRIVKQDNRPLAPAAEAPHVRQRRVLFPRFVHHLHPGLIDPQKRKPAKLPGKKVEKRVVAPEYVDRPGAHRRARQIDADAGEYLLKTIQRQPVAEFPREYIRQKTRRRNPLGNDLRRKLGWFNCAFSLGLDALALFTRVFAADMALYPKLRRFHGELLGYLVSDMIAFASARTDFLLFRQVVNDIMAGQFRRQRTASAFSARVTGYTNDACCFLDISLVFTMRLDLIKQTSLQHILRRELLAFPAEDLIV